MLNFSKITYSCDCKIMARFDPKSIKLILFDLDDTLCDTASSKHIVFSELYRNNEEFHKVSEPRFIEVIAAKRQEYLTNAKGLQTYSRIKMWVETAKELKIQLPVRKYKHLIDQYWQLSFHKLNLFEGAQTTLEAVYNSPITTALLASSDFYSKATKLLTLGIDKYFNFIFTSDLVKISKNNPSMYKYVSNYTGCTGEESIMVGNDPKQDIAPAKSAGMWTIQTMISKQTAVSDNYDDKPHYIIYNVSGIMELLNLPQS